MSVISDINNVKSSERGSAVCLQSHQSAGMTVRICNISKEADMFSLFRLVIWTINFVCVCVCVCIYDYSLYTHTNLYIAIIM